MATFFNILFYAIIMALVFGVMIFIHEAGHFFTARACGITVKEFAIGMGPKLFSWTSKKYGTQHSLRLLPIGGYVSMEGEDDDSEDENAFCNKPVWKRMLVVAAGPFMNIILGILLTLVVVLAQGPIGSTVIAQFNDNAVSNEKLNVKLEALKAEKVSAMMLLSEESRRMMEMMEAQGKSMIVAKLLGNLKSMDRQCIDDIETGVVQKRNLPKPGGPSDTPLSELFLC